MQPTMVRTILTALLLTTAFGAFAQRPDFEPIDNDAMAATAAKHMKEVDRLVDLSAEQERMQGQPKEDVEADMKSQEVAIGQYIDRELEKVLTPAQMYTWRERSKQ
jgi:hypothetical protein